MNENNDFKDEYDNDNFTPAGPKTALVAIIGRPSSGKSTFLKSVALSLILAETIYTVPAERFETVPVEVCKIKTFETASVTEIIDEDTGLYNLNQMNLQIQHFFHQLILFLNYFQNLKLLIYNYFLYLKILQRKNYYLTY